jgi:UTP--glucose-1-phosphate uridylyltransferase
VLTPRIFHHINTIPRGAGGEIQLTDAIASLKEEEDVYALRFQGKRYDCGSKLGYLKACVELGMTHEEVGRDFTDYLKNFSRTHF